MHEMRMMRCKRRRNVGGKKVVDQRKREKGRNG